MNVFVWLPFYYSDTFQHCPLHDLTHPRSIVTDVVAYMIFALDLSIEKPGRTDLIAHTCRHCHGVLS